jgi:hypothetical protein
MEAAIRCVVVIRIPHENIGFPSADESTLWYDPEPVLVASAGRFPAVDLTGTEVQVLAEVQNDRIQSIHGNYRVDHDSCEGQVRVIDREVQTDVDQIKRMGTRRILLAPRPDR